MIATWSPTSRSCARRTAGPVVAERPPLRNAAASHRPLRRSAGASATARPLARATTTTKPSPRGPTLSSSSRGRLRGPKATSASTAISARTQPTSPPASPSTAPSARNPATRSRRVAPSAVRTDSSRSRPAARTRKRFATLAHESKRKKPTALMTIHRLAPRSPTTWSRSGTTRVVKPASASIFDPCSTGKRSASGARAASARSAASSGVVPGGSRATESMPSWPNCVAAGSTSNGNQIRVSGSGKRRSSGKMPTISRSTPSIRIRSPTTPGAPPNRRRQSRSPRSATGSAPGRASSVRKGRPRIGATPSVSVSDGDTQAAGTRSGAASPERFTAPVR